MDDVDLDLALRKLGDLVLDRLQRAGNVGLDDQAQLLARALLGELEDVLQRHLSTRAPRQRLGLEAICALAGELTRATLVLDHAHEFTGLWNAIEAEHLHRLARRRSLHARTGEVMHRADPSEVRAGDERVAPAQRPALVRTLTTGPRPGSSFDSITVPEASVSLLAVALYSMAVKTVVPVSSCRAAEATKLLENTFRGVNIALMNELKVVYSAMGIDIWEVINAAKTKPFGFMPFYPGPGLGGHCIPIDPFYLTWKAREYGQNTRFIELAGEINTAMPAYVVHRVADALNDRQKAIKGSSILVLGLAYKPNVDDERESPSYVLMDMLKERGAKVAYHDPYVPAIKPTREHGHWAGTKSVEWKKETITAFDLVLLATNHACINYQELADWTECIVDTRNAMAAIPTLPNHVWKA